MSRFPTLDDIDVAGKRVLLRGDLNVPIADGRITETSRLERLAPTVNELTDKGARVVLLSHYGRPKGRRRTDMSLAPVAREFGHILGVGALPFAEDCIGPAAAEVVEGLAEGDIAVLENVRFHDGETRNDPAFVKQLAALGDIYVNDAFSAAHRAHASTEGLARVMPCAAGRLMEAELRALNRALEDPDRPLAAVVGGAKISTKLDLLGNLMAQVDRLIIGGGMANTFLNARGHDVGNSLCEHDMADTAREVMAAAEAKKCRILLPTDVVVAEAFEANAPNRTVGIDEVSGAQMILDIGPGTIDMLRAEIDTCRTLVWNGPMGAFELPPFDRGTNELAREVAALSTSGKLLSVAGGGDTVAALVHAGVVDHFSYVSTAGGAFLEWLEGKELPGVAALRRAEAVA